MLSKLRKFASTKNSHVISCYKLTVHFGNRDLWAKTEKFPSSTSSTQISPGTVNHIDQTSFPCLKNQHRIQARPIQHSFPGIWLWSEQSKIETGRGPSLLSPVLQLLRPAVSSHPRMFSTCFLSQLLASAACNSLAHLTSQTDILKHISISSVYM